MILELKLKDFHKVYDDTLLFYSCCLGALRALRAKYCVEALYSGALLL